MRTNVQYLFSSLGRLVVSMAGFMFSASTIVGAEPIPDAMREQWQIPGFYQKMANAGGIPVIGSAKVRTEALDECAWLVRQMLVKRPDIIAALCEAKVRFAIMAHDEYTTDLPEQASMQPRVYWDRRARGLGATPDKPIVSGGEENLLSYPGDPHPTEIIPLHEFAHAIHLVAMAKVDPTFNERLTNAYKSATSEGLWKGTYAAVDVAEYWAEAVQAWFDNNAENNALHNSINTRKELEEYDPVVAALCREVFKDNEWTYKKPEARAAADREHLKTFDRSQAPTFHWREEPVPEQPRISIDCALGEIQLESQNVLAGEDRNRWKDLLSQVQEGWYSSSQMMVRDKQVLLVPAKQTPSGIPVPQDGTHWSLELSNGEAKPTEGKGLSIRVRKGDDVLAKIRQNTGEIAVQRIVRLN